MLDLNNEHVSAFAVSSAAMMEAKGELPLLAKPAVATEAMTVLYKTETVKKKKM